MAQEARRSKKRPSMQQVFSDILCQPAGEKDAEGVLSLCKQKPKPVQQALALSIIETALEGDLKAADFIVRMTGKEIDAANADQPLSVTIKVVE